MRYFFLLIAILISGCSSTDKYQAPSDLAESNAAIVYLYRTDVLYHSLNPERPFFYLDDKLVAKLGTGSFVTFLVSPGQHTLTSKESILFVPSSESGKIAGTFEAGKEYYFRYSKEFSNIVSYGVGFTISDKSSLTLATEQQFINKS